MKALIRTIQPILQSYGVQKASLFGSVAAGTADEHSDVDIIIDPPASMGLSFVDLKLDLEEKLDKKVDLITFGSVNTHFKPYIDANQVPILYSF